MIVKSRCRRTSDVVGSQNRLRESRYGAVLVSWRSVEGNELVVVEYRVVAYVVVRVVYVARWVGLARRRARPDGIVRVQGVALDVVVVLEKLKSSFWFMDSFFFLFWFMILALFKFDIWKINLITFWIHKLEKKLLFWEICINRNCLKI